MDFFESDSDESSLILNKSAVSKNLKKPRKKYFSEDDNSWKPKSDSDTSSKADAAATPIKKEKKKDRDTHDGNKKMLAYATPTASNSVKTKRATGRIETHIHLPNFVPSASASAARTIVTPNNKCIHCRKAPAHVFSTRK